MLVIRGLINYRARVTAPVEETPRLTRREQRRDAVANGRCGECIRRPCLPGFKTCETCRDAKDKYR